MYGFFQLTTFDCAIAFSKAQKGNSDTKKMHHKVSIQNETQNHTVRALLLSRFIILNALEILSALGILGALISTIRALLLAIA